MPKRQDFRLHSLKQAAARQGWAQWIRTEQDERALLEGCWFDKSKVDRFCTFSTNCLVLTEGSQFAGKPFQPLDWQYNDVIAPLFGWQRRHPDMPERIVRRHRIVYVEIPKKNGKSPLAAAVGLYLLMADSEHGAKVFSAATERDQAAIVHNHAIRMVEASDELLRRLRINYSSKVIYYDKAQSEYRALSGKVTSKEGLNAHGLICDELHAWSGWELWNTLKYATASRLQPVWFSITTAGTDSTGPCYAQHRYAEQVNSGEVDDIEFLGVIYAAEPDDDLEDPEAWTKANPSLGTTIYSSTFQRELKEAKSHGGTVWTQFKRYRFNLWATGRDPWLDSTHWEACREEYTEEDLRGLPCYGGMDLSKVSDTTALALLFPDETEEVLRLLLYYWLPEETALNLRQTVPYQEWADQGFIKLQKGRVLEYDPLLEDIGRIIEQFEVREINFDPWQADPISKPLEQSIPVGSFSQKISTFAMPTEEFERRVLNHTIRHNGNPVLSWQVGNTEVKLDPSGNKRPVKPGNNKNSTSTIDGTVASIMALESYIHHEGDDDGPSVYEERGLVVL